MRAVLLAVIVALPACSLAQRHFTDGDGGSDGAADSGPDAPPVPSGDYVWIRSLSQAATQTIAASPGGIVTPGYLYASANLGGQQLTSAGGADMIIASFSEADASHLYSVRHGDVGNEFALDAVIDDSGTPIIYGVTYGTVDIGQGQVAGGGGVGADGYIGRYAAGEPSWTKRIVGPGEDKFIAASLGANSTVYGAGWFEQTTSFNNTSYTSVGGRDLILARFNTFTGDVDLVKQYGGTGRDEVGGAASLGTSLVLGGFSDDTIAFGGTAAPITASQGGLDIWVAKLAADGTGVWAVTFGGPGDDRDTRVVMDAAGDVYVTGVFVTSMTMGAFPLTAVGGADHFIAKLRGTDGSVVWAISFGSLANETGGVIAVDTRGHLAFCGPVYGALDTGATNGGVDALVAMFDASTGALNWRHVYSTPGDDRGGGVAFGTSGDLIAAITLAGPFDFGHPVIGEANPIGVLMRIAP